MHFSSICFLVATFMASVLANGNLDCSICVQDDSSIRACGKFNNGTTKEFSNRCLAQCSGAESSWSGNCDGAAIACSCAPNQPTVCGADGKTTNACDAGCRGIRVAYEGECKKEEKVDCSICSTETSSTGACGKFEDGSTKPFGNVCLARCSGAESAWSGTCDGKAISCSCARDDELVCAANGKTYLKCEALCNAFRIVSNGECKKDDGEKDDKEDDKEECDENQEKKDGYETNNDDKKDDKKKNDKNSYDSNNYESKSSDADLLIASAAYALVAAGALLV